MYQKFVTKGKLGDSTTDYSPLLAVGDIKRNIIRHNQSSEDLSQTKKLKIDSNHIVTVQDLPNL